MSASYFLGIDTSNYKTSVAITDENGHILYNIQKFLQVKKGERGLRQSAALFQHVNTLPNLISEILSDDNIRNNIKAIAVSTRPRPIEGSYMPVFNAGISSAKVMAAALGVPCYKFSHQEGHIEAIRYYTEIKKESPFISFHFSGGTTEALLVDEGKISIIGGSKDISYGQVLDRIGVSLGMDFPCGSEMDTLALTLHETEHQLLPKIKVKEGWINLSGIETKAQGLISSTTDTKLIEAILYRISESIVNISLELAKAYNINDFIFAGGVSSSKYIREYIKANLSNLNVYFGEAELSTDNAVGIALLGGQAYGY